VGRPFLGGRREQSRHALAPELVSAAVPLVPVLRRGRRIWEPGLPLTEVAAASFPKLVVSGGHSAGDAICDDLADRIGASRMVVEGAGHEIQFTGPPVSHVLLALWRSAGRDRDAIVLIREQYVVARKLVDRTLSLLHVGRPVRIPT